MPTIDKLDDAIAAAITRDDYYILGVVGTALRERKVGIDSERFVLMELRAALRTAATPPEPVCTCRPLFSGHVVEHPDCPRGRAEALATPPKPGLDALLRQFDALGGFSGGHTARGEVDAKGYCWDCDRTRPYTGWHEKAELATSIRARLSETPR